MAINANLTVTQSFKQDSPARVSGKVVYPATAIVEADETEIVLGFTPQWVKWVNLTDRIEGEWFAGMDDNSCLKRAAAGTGTLESVGITPTSKGFKVDQDATLALVLANKTCAFIAG